MKRFVGYYFLCISLTLMACTGSDEDRTGAEGSADANDGLSGRGDTSAELADTDLDQSSEADSLTDDSATDDSETAADTGVQPDSEPPQDVSDDAGDIAIEEPDAVDVGPDQGDAAAEDGDGGSEPDSVDEDAVDLDAADAVDLDAADAVDLDAADAIDLDAADAIDLDAADADAGDPDAGSPGCPAGFNDVNGDGTLCANIDECELGVSDCDGLVTCTDTEGSWSCGVCPAGFDDVNGDGTLCANIDECALGVSGCDGLVTCTDTEGSWSCGVCPAGFDDVNGDGTLCTNVDECGLLLDDCDSLVSCTDTPGSWSCGDCPAGYRDVNGDGSQCVNVDECVEGLDNCDALVTCADTLGSWTCGACPSGYADPNADGTLCQNVNECIEGLDDCDSLVTCTDTPGSWTCGACPSGYRNVNGDGTLCLNIDECSEGLDDCDALVTCTDTPGSYSCGPCPFGWRDVRGNGRVCESRFASPPAGMPQCYLWGTSHLRTFDGLAYDLQGAGEWQMVVDPGALGFEVQLRQQPLSGSNAASRTTAVAMRVGSRRVELRTNAGSVESLVDGLVVSRPAAGVDLGVASIHNVGSTVVVTWVAGPQVRVTPVGARLDVEIYPSPALRGTLQGLCADADANPVNDVRPPGGAPILPPITIENLYTLHVHPWRVTSSNSLFTYAAGTGPDTSFVATFPQAYIEGSDLSATERARWEPQCRAAELGNPWVDDACILDASLDTIAAALESASRVQDPSLILPLDKPLPFASWQQQGVLSNGNWTVSSNFLSVLQTINGNPTFFVSPNSYLNVLIEGTIAVETTTDDDIVGFVFGYRSPFRDDPDPFYTFDTYLFDWKQIDQTFNGSFSAEGYSLAYVDGIFSVDWVPFWLRTDRLNPNWTVLDTQYSATDGWLDNRVNTFRLLHTAHRVDVWINGVRIFQVAGDFQSGHFGFYNNSQQSVRYANFRVRNVDSFTLCGDAYPDPGESCDDGNLTDGDGCSATCQSEGSGG
jgi:cysteine-rich repeat protein